MTFEAAGTILDWLAGALIALPILLVVAFMAVDWLEGRE